jgi:phage baseplate assembly protein W
MSDHRRFDLAYPVRIDNRGRLASADYRSHVRDMVEQVLFTRPGERVNRPDFGTPIPEIVFERATQDMLTNVQFLVQTSLQKFMGDVIIVEDVSVSAEENRIDIVIAYLVLPLRERVKERFVR